MFIRAYLRASTAEQDATRASADLEKFASEHGVVIAASYIENESGAKLDRPELFRLIRDAKPGDVLLIEQVDRLTRLKSADWDKLKAVIAEKGLRIVSLDLPTSWQALKPGADDITAAVLKAVNQMLLDILAATSRKDYEDRRRRQAQGIAKAKTEGKFKGRPVDEAKHKNIADLLGKGVSWNSIVSLTGASRSTILRVSKALAAE
jgi:DNA invertase Pin-like site-specific DNA recombinase